MCAPLLSSVLMILIETASLMSSVFGLNDSPSMAIFLFFSSPMSSSASSIILYGCSLLISSVAFTNGSFVFIFSPNFMSALRSFGQHEPPQPAPAFRKCGPILLSNPIAFATVSTSVPGIFWQRLAIMFMKLTFIARNALLAYLINSAFSKLVMIFGLLKSWYISSKILALFSSFAPITILSGFMQSSIALPSFKNSGFTAIPKSL